MYAAGSDPYCYPGSTVLVNLAGLRDGAALEAFEFALSRERATQPLPAGRCGITHYRAIHRHLFQDVYAWAGTYRTVRISKGGSTFCYPEHIASEMRRLFGELRGRRHLRGLAAGDFSAAAAHFLAELNAIHPFREGNGRSQMVFFALISDRAGHRLRLDRLDPTAFLEAMVASFDGHEGPLSVAISDLIRP